MYIGHSKLNATAIISRKKKSEKNVSFFNIYFQNIFLQLTF